MRRITTRIVLLASFLIPGIYAVQAEQAANMKGSNKLLAKNSKQVFSDSLNSLKKLSLNNKIKSNNNSALNKFKRRITYFERLKLNKNISIPQNNEEVLIQEILPITLKEVQKLMISNNPDLKVMKTRVEQESELVKSSIARWYPTINLNANGLPEYLTADNYRNPDFGSDTKTKQWKTSMSVQVQWNLIDPIRVPTIAAAKDSYEKARDSYLITLRDLKLRAANQYFLLQRADEGVRIGKQSMQASLISLRDAKARFEAGVATRLEVLEAETQLARDKQLLTGKLGDQKITRRSIANTLNLPQGTTPIAASSAKVIGTWQASLQESIIAAYSFREELNRLLLDISINNNNANIALGATQPTISLSNNLSYTNTKGQSGISSTSSIDMDDYSSSISNSIAINANWTIFDGGRAKALYKYNKLKAKEAEESFISRKNSIRQEVEESFFNLQTANQDIATTTREVLASRESLRLARLRFQAGVTTQREVVNNQRDLTQAEVRYSDAITNYNRSLSQLQRRTGIDPVKACESKISTSSEVDKDNLIDMPIEPFPLIPACEASTIQRKE